MNFRRSIIMGLVFITTTMLVIPAMAQGIGITSGTGGGVINIGQALGPVLQPYVDAAVQALIVIGIGWLSWFFKTKLNINIDQGHADALARFAQGRANSLIADGFVKMNGLQVTVDNAALASEVNAAATMIPDAVAHFGITPDQLAAKIKDAIPQVPAGAAIVANAHAIAPAA
jgi:hypothetical protein